ncbi:unnamed protein product [Lepeophtheirus salmonis]|uniref:(salmon louse) hypothetical protein n=1 Tax=Lepeophtheirus salmonis TaxID=72036 RepID=A0A7R8H3Q1_LEPSM|nr:unnamed protein product [Lepeophtheirus salmonis]CAF2834073.1 unnamed protein product [Lepeophtheirus salmonis]
MFAKLRKPLIIKLDKRHCGEAPSPFRRHECNPRMVTKHKDGSFDDVLPLLDNAKENDNVKERRVQYMTIIPTPYKKRKHVSIKEKTDLLDVHNFDIEIDVDTTLGPSNPVSVNFKPVSLAQNDHLI